MLCRICGLQKTVGRGAYCQRCLDGEIDGMNPEDIEAGAELLDRVQLVQPIKKEDER